MAVSEGAAHRFVVFLDQIVDHLGAVRNLDDTAHDFEQLSKGFLARVLHFDFVRNTPQEGVVDKILGFEVGAEDHQLIEGDLDLLAAEKGQIVVPFFEGNDPAMRSSSTVIVGGQSRRSARRRSCF